MKLLIVLSLVSTTIYAGTYSINPSRTVTPLVDIFSSQTKRLDDKMMEVRVSSYNNSGEIFKGSTKSQMAIPLYEKALAQSNAVFQMIPAASSVPAEGVSFLGTAFHIGQNLVLTNQHVLSPDRTNSTECGGFQLRSNKGSYSFACKKVHYCNVEEDVCLIEMEPAKNCLNFWCTKNEIIELKNGPALKLNGIAQNRSETAVMTCIGNTMGQGIHFSQGRGVWSKGDVVYFYAPLRTGNSGGPLIGEDGLVWGVAKFEGAKEIVGNAAFNGAASAEKVISLMREQLSGDPETLKKFNSAIVE